MIKQLRKGLFTVFVDDNLDENSSSYTATSNFHGGSVTTVQFFSEGHKGEIRYKKKFSELNEEEQKPGNCEALRRYLNVEPVQLPKRSFCPIQTVNISDEFTEELHTVFCANKKAELEWMAIVIEELFAVNNQTSSSLPVSWTLDSAPFCKK